MMIQLFNIWSYHQRIALIPIFAAKNKNVKIYVQQKNDIIIINKFLFIAT